MENWFLKSFVFSVQEGGWFQREPWHLYMIVLGLAPHFCRIHVGVMGGNVLAFKYR